MPTRHAGPRRAPRDPWFRRNPRLTVLVIGALFAGVLALRLVAGTPVDAYSMFYVLPVALAAAAFGHRGGLLAGLLGVVLIVVWAVVRNVELGPTAWASRVVPIVLLGALLGRATGREREAEAERRRLEVAAVLHREAIEINDSLIQQMTAAKWAIEGGQTERARGILAAAVSDAQRLVSGLIRRAGMADRTARPVNASQPHDAV